jgi:hypothetical protein
VTTYDSNDFPSMELNLGHPSPDPGSSHSDSNGFGLREEDGPLEDDDPIGTVEMVDDMAYRVWKCGR